MKYSHYLLFVILAGLTGPLSAIACSVCGCSLSSDWGIQGHADTTGSFSSVRFEYFDQTDLRHGTGSVDRSTLPFPQDDEVQQYTINRNLWLRFDHVFDQHWSISVQLPFYDRDHGTIAEGDSIESLSHARGPGDLKLIGRYMRRLSFGTSWDLQFGLKLPTGRFDQNFALGPQAGERLDRGLQLGTGTTDLLLGASWYGRPKTHLGIFAQVQADQPLSQRDSFAPSPSLVLSSGVRWLSNSDFVPQMQVNANFQGRERGLKADTDNSGGIQIYLSPGLTFDFTRKLSLFAFLQLPVFQRLNGLQLQPDWLVTAGVNWRW